MEKPKRIPIVVPFFQEDLEIFSDMIDSIEAYFKLPFHLIVVDDFSRDGSYEKLLEYFKHKNNVTILRNKKNYGWGFGLWQTQGEGLIWAYHNLQFDFALRMDCDSLIINHGLDEILSKLYSDKSVGIVGQLVDQEHKLHIYKTRIPIKYRKLAEKNGYLMREDFKGVFWTMHEGVLSLSREFLGKLIRNKMFEEKARYGGIYSRWYGSKGLFEGPLLAVLCYFFGFRAVNLSSMRIGYRLEMLHEIPYEMFREIGVRAIHPLKPSKSADDLAFKVRSYFKNCREKDRAANRGQ